MRARFFWKLYAGYVAVILLTTASVGWLVYRQVGENALRESRISLRAQANLLRSLSQGALHDGRESGLNATLVTLGRLNQVRYTVVAADGRVLADSHADSASMDDHSTRPEIISARTSELGSTTRYSRTLKKMMMYVALPVRDGGQVLAFARTARPLDEAARSLEGLRTATLLGAGGAALVGLLLGYGVARRITGPLASITRSAESIAEGNYDQLVPATSRDEIGKLAVAFNRMTEHLKDRIQTLDRERHQVVAVLSGMVEGLIAVDGEQRVVHMNTAAARFLGVVSHQTLGKAISSVTRVPELLEAISEVMKQGQAATTEVTIPALRDLEFELHAAPLVSESGQLDGAVLVMHDITALRRLESVRRDFVANVSHELKTPLAAIRGLVETMADDDQMDPATRTRFLGKLKSQSSRLSALVTDLLVLSRVESGTGLEEPVPVDVVEVVGEAARLMQAQAERQGLSLELQTPEHPVIIEGDEEALHQMVTNLLSNALKYTDAGGMIWLRVSSGAGRAIIEVEDTGIGIPAGHISRLFERFYRVDKARSRELGGTGLGLSIVKHIALSLGGNVSVESTQGEGSTFRVSLPEQAAGGARSRLQIDPAP